MAKQAQAIIGKCALCKKDNVKLELSHIIPKFVTRRILKKSITGFMRNVFDPNQRLQDGDKEYLLCPDCEDLFSKYETKFANFIFHPYKNSSQQSYEYDEWLNYFITSVNWRNLYLDLEGFKKDPKISKSTLSHLQNQEEQMRKYLLGQLPSIENIENHMFFFEDILSAPDKIKQSEPHSFIRHSSFGYSLISHDYDGQYVVSNLSGILIFTILKKSSIDIWEKTRIEKKGIYTLGNQHIQSPIASDVMEYMSESRSSQSSISQNQHDKIITDLKKNSDKIPTSEIFKNREIDNDLTEN